MTEFDINQADFITLAASILDSGAILRFRARGASMRPLIKDGDTVWVAPLNIQPKPGDILLFKTRDGRLFVHRLVQTQTHASRQMYQCQGDAVLVPDEWIDEEHLLGRVVSLQRGNQPRRVNTLPSYCLARLWLFSLRCIKGIILLILRLRRGSRINGKDN